MRFIIYLLILFFTFSCDKQNNENQNVVLPSKKLHKGNHKTGKYNYSDSLFYDVLRNINYSDCGSIRKNLKKIYYADQKYRDSSQFYRRLGNHQEKVDYFGNKFKQADEVNELILLTIIDSLNVKKKCLTSEVEFHAIWLVAHHSKNKELILNVYPLVKHGFDKSFIESDAYNLYYDNIRKMNIDGLPY